MIFSVSGKVVIISLSYRPSPCLLPQYVKGLKDSIFIHILWIRVWGRSVDVDKQEGREGGGSANVDIFCILLHNIIIKC